MKKTNNFDYQIFKLKYNRYPIPVIFVVHESSNYLWWILDHLVISGITIIWNLEKDLEGPKRKQFYNIINSEVVELKKKFTDVIIVEVWPENKKRKFRIRKDKTVLLYVGSEKSVAPKLLGYFSMYIKVPESSEVQGTYKPIELNSYIHQYANPQKHIHGLQVGVKDFEVLSLYKMTKINLKELAFISAGFLKGMGSYLNENKRKSR